ncbi:uracil-DNA glycosylase family protein [Lacticaseibacillus rhamnosus]|uniref:hypothetical protein n=1 Tax=Lacticaseibacillus rhamnosus TaxID=47715 RepID=UPI001CDAD59E|nr:hypothetical protein [Lacticaseibacillus rhamnosus]
MNEQANFATKVLTLHQRLASVKMTLPGSYQLVNPYSGEQKHAVDQITAAFYHKYFNDLNFQVKCNDDNEFLIVV